MTMTLQDLRDFIEDMAVTVANPEKTELKLLFGDIQIRLDEALIESFCKLPNRGELTLQPEMVEKATILFDPF